MIGARTKQVNSYGKRHQRIVSVSEDRFKDSPSIFDDLAPAPRLTSVASKMKKRENVVNAKPKSPSPRMIRVHKKRISPVKKKQTRLTQIINAEIHTHNSPIAKTKSPNVSGSKVTDPANATPRTPLAPFSDNVPGSPAIAGKVWGKGKDAQSKGALLKSNKPFSPFIDMDIILLDNDGQTLSVERRVSRTNIEINTVNRRVSRTKRNLFLSDSTDSDLEIIEQPRPFKRLSKKAPPARVYSDDSDSDNAPLVPSPARAQKLKTSPTPKAGPSHLKVEVVIPPAPYPLHNIVNAPARAVPRRAGSPPNAVPPRYPHFPSPVARARQLTPIRGRRGNHFEPPSPPSPSTSTDLDLSLDFTELGLDSPSKSSSYQHEPDIPAYLKPLLEECHQETCGPHNFSAFIETFRFDPVVHPFGKGAVKAADVKFKKIGEASYSEVFGIGDVVLKVIPLRDETPSGDSLGSNSQHKMNAKYNEYGEEEEGPAPSDAKDVRKEIIVTRAMGEVCDGFVELLRTYIVKGKYPEVLLNLWDDYNEKKGSESVRPDTFSVSQVYAIIVLPNGGPDLEAYTFLNAGKTGWRHACSIFWQVAKALAHAEQLVSFEHRDLHWGQILVKNISLPAAPPLKVQNPNQRSKPKPVRLPMDDHAHGVRATLIDLGLSRMDAGDGDGGEKVHWTPFDDEIFMGEGDYQFDIYRIMRDYTGGSWEKFNPLTNVMWLHYLALKLLHSKRLKAPALPRKGQSNVSSTPIKSANFTERDCYECLIDIEKWLGKCVASISATKTKVASKGKARRKTQASAETKPVVSFGPSCAGEVVGYGVKREWITPTS